MWMRLLGGGVVGDDAAAGLIVLDLNRFRRMPVFSDFEVSYSRLLRARMMSVGIMYPARSRRSAQGATRRSERGRGSRCGEGELGFVLWWMEKAGVGGILVA